jgi:hypothetical protein
MLDGSFNRMGEICTLANIFDAAPRQSWPQQHRPPRPEPLPLDAMIVENVMTIRDRMQSDRHALRAYWSGISASA